MRKIFFFLLVTVLVLVPWIADNRYVFHTAAMTVIMMSLSLSLYLMLKIGQLSLAQSAFMGMGAYASALLTMRLGLPSMLSLLSGGIIAAVFAAILGPVFLRIKGVQFALLTFAFGQIVNLIFLEWTSLFGGASGLVGIPKFSVFGLQLTEARHYYILGLIFVVITFTTMRAIDRSDIGAILQSLNENEMLSRAIGSNALSWRIAAFILSAFIAGIGGGIYAFYIRFLSPDAFSFMTSVDLIVMNVIGGTISALGPTLGAIVVVPLPELLRGAREYQLLVYGLCLIIFLLFFKQGLASCFECRRRND